MSSDYDILCLSHDPAIRIETGHRDPASAVAKVQRGLPEHPGCDLMVGQFSYPLIELCCVGFETQVEADRRPHSGWHRDPIWADAGLLRIAALAWRDNPFANSSQPEGCMGNALARLPMCWTRDRLLRLRFELGIADQP